MGVVFSLSTEFNLTMSEIKIAVNKVKTVLCEIEIAVSKVEIFAVSKIEIA